MPVVDSKAAFDHAHLLYRQGRYRAALAAAENLNRQTPGHTPYLALEISSLLRLAKPGQAARKARRALRQVTLPAHRTTLINQLVESFIQQDRFEEAISAALDELDKRPDDEALLAAACYALQLGGKKDQARDLATQARERGAASISAATAFGHAAMRTDPDTEADAIAFLRHALETDPEQPEEIRGRALNQLGHLLDRAKDYDAAFAAFKASNDIVPAEYVDDAHQQRVDLIRAHWTAESITQTTRPTPPASGPRPVFILGMPRSGTSLTEQIIDAHPNAYGAGELPLIGELIRDAAPSSPGQPSSDPDAWSNPPTAFDPAKLQAAADTYRSELAQHAAAAGQDPNALVLITDKAPDNCWHIGHIAALLPDARIIHCRRDPRDNCLSIYFQALAAGHTYSFDLRNCGLHYRHYRDATDHFRHVLQDPGVAVPMLEVNYEETVADQEAQTRRILDFVGLPFDEACLRFNESGRITKTLSSDQVTQKIYTSSTKRYERYADHIAPLAEALGDLIPA